MSLLTFLHPSRSEWQEPLVHALVYFLFLSIFTLRLTRHFLTRPRLLELCSVDYKKFGMWFADLLCRNGENQVTREHPDYQAHDMLKSYECSACDLNHRNYYCRHRKPRMLQNLCKS